MSDTITVLPTEYKGITFRSRTEARWAVLFDHLPLVWNYEPEGHAISGRGYLPDFYLPQLKMWFEVKPNETDGSERDVFHALVRDSGKAGVIAYGPPHVGDGNLSHFNPNGEVIDGLLLCEDRRDKEVYWLAKATAAFAIGGPGIWTDHDRLPVIHGRIAEAYKAAAKERFGT